MDVSMYMNPIIVQRTHSRTKINKKNVKGSVLFADNVCSLRRFYFLSLHRDYCAFGIRS